MDDRHALNVLLNVARHDNLAHFIAKGANAVHVVVDLMQMFRDKKSVFSLVCELTCRLISSQKETKVRIHGSDLRWPRCYVVALTVALCIALCI